MDDLYFYYYDTLPPKFWDELLAYGWRRGGNLFYKVSLETDLDTTYTVLPLRIDVSKFVPSRSQRRNLRRNADVMVVARPACITNDARDLFMLHREKFTRNIPESPESYIGPDNFPRPVNCMEIAVYLKNKLIAISYIDEAETSFSSVYAYNDPAFNSRGLGIFTLLQEIEYCRLTGKKYLYLGYAFEEPSFYDYKKQFAATEALRNDEWVSLPRFG